MKGEKTLQQLLNVLDQVCGFVMQVSDKMDPSELVQLCEILNPRNRPGRLTIITRMGADNMRVKLPLLIRAVRQAGLIVTWVSDPMHGNTIKAPCGLKTRSFDSIRVRMNLSTYKHVHCTFTAQIDVDVDAVFLFYLGRVESFL